MGTASPTSARTTLPIPAAPLRLLAAALVCLLAGLWGGHLLLGLPNRPCWPPPRPGPYGARAARTRSPTRGLRIVGHVLRYRDARRRVVDVWMGFHRHRRSIVAVFLFARRPSNGAES